MGWLDVVTKTNLMQTGKADRTRGSTPIGDTCRESSGSSPLPLVAFRVALCEGSDMDIERNDGADPIDVALLECFLELSLKGRIQSAANYANAIEKLRRLRPADDSERPA
jgi:hypothetical protein